MFKFLTRNRLILILITIVMFFAILAIGPLDMFSHGFYSDTINYTQVYSEDISLYDLSEDVYIFSFEPKEKHFAGLEINFVKEVEGLQDTIKIDIYDEKNNCIEKIQISTKDIVSKEWYKIYIDAELSLNNIYTVEISLKNKEKGLFLQLVDKSYLHDEQVNGNLLVCYAYEKSTFMISEKILLCIGIFALWLLAMSKIFGVNKNIQKFKHISFFMIITIGLAWNYMYNTMDVSNLNFEYFQNDSETLVTGAIYAEQKGLFTSKYGLGRYTDVLAKHTSYRHKFANDSMWIDSYCITEPMLALANNEYIKTISKVGNYIKFSNGEIFEIVGNQEKGSWIYITLNSEKPLSNEKFGSLIEAKFYDENLNEYSPGEYMPYNSQYGLQGKVFKVLSSFIDNDNIVELLNLLCCFATAITFSLIVLLIQRKYNSCMAVMFYITFMLSPWIVNFARNMYWVEFTWFIPMLIGLICSLYTDNKIVRISSYIATLVAMCIKCLCGYEYISTVMLAMIVFLIADFADAYIKKDKNAAKLYFRTVVIIGVSALIGFMVAMCIHAQIRGNGEIMSGIKMIIKEDVLRRTNGANLNDLNENYWPSLNASIWETLCKYFDFPTEIITGIRGNLFPLLCIVPLCVFLIDYKRKEIDVKKIVMYFMFFAASISWFVLAKSHSYIHTHMNYVLWYLGFVQIALYIIIDKIIRLIKEDRTKINSAK